MLQKTTTAKEKTEKAKEFELIELAASAAKIDGEGTITTENLSNELKSNFGNNENITETSNFIYYKGYRIYKDGRVEEGALLPNEYQQVEYIESSGTQYIDTQYAPTLLTGVDITACLTIENNGDKILFGSRYQDRRFYLDFDYYFGQYSLSPCLGSWTVHTNSYQINKEYQFLFNYNGNSKVYVYENEYDINNTFNPDKSISMYIFGANKDGSPFLLSGFKVYNCKILEKDLMIKNFTPCYSTTTVTDVNGKQCPAGTVGLYDTVEGKFYTNQGTGTFGYELEDGTYVAPSPTNN